VTPRDLFTIAGHLAETIGVGDATIADCEIRLVTDDGSTVRMAWTTLGSIAVHYTLADGTTDAGVVPAIELPQLAARLRAGLPA